MVADRKPSIFERHASTTPKDFRNSVVLGGTIIAWALASAGSLLLLDRFESLVPDGPISWAIASLPTVLGVALVVVFTRYLRETDELQRTLQLQAVAIAFGGTYFAFAAYGAFEPLGAPPATFDHYFVVVCAVYSSISFLNWRRYR